MSAWNSAIYSEQQYPDSYARMQRHFTDDEIRQMWRHYTVGEGAGHFAALGPETTFRNFVVFYDFVVLWQEEL